MSSSDKLFNRSTFKKRTQSEVIISLLNKLDANECRGSLLEIITLVLSIDIRLEIYVLKWISPVLGSIPYHSITSPLEFAKSPLDKWALCLFTKSVVTQSKELLKVPYATQDGERIGRVSVALFPGDCVNLLYQPEIWYTIYEIRADKEAILVASEEKFNIDISSNKKKLAQRKQFRSYKELSSIFFLGCVVRRDCELGVLGDVRREWRDDMAADGTVAATTIYEKHEIFFKVPSADNRSSFHCLLEKIKQCKEKSILGEELMLHNNNIAPSRQTVVANKTSSRIVGSNNKFEALSSRNQTSSQQKDPIEEFQRRKYVESWASRKSEIKIALQLLSNINPFPDTNLIQTIINARPPNSYNNGAVGETYADSLDVSNFRRSIWLNIGRSLRTICRSSTESPTLLTAWKLWTRRGNISAVAQVADPSSSRHLNLNLRTEKAEKIRSYDVDIPNESMCVPAWHSQRLPTTCDVSEVVEARSYFRRRLNQLNKQGKRNIYIIFCN